MLQPSQDADVIGADAGTRGQGRMYAALDLGFLAIAVSFGVLAYGLYQHWTGHTVRGWTSTMVTILFLGGVQLFTLGVIGEYLSRMHDEIKGRPLYVVDEEINLERDE